MSIDISKGFLIFFVSWIVLGIVLVLIGIFLEKKGYNHGICLHCDKNLELFDTDSHGGRGYICPHCGYITWVSYDSVDHVNKIRKDNKL